MEKRVLIVVAVAAAGLLLIPPEIPSEDAQDEPDYQGPDLPDAATSVLQEAQDMLSTKRIANKQCGLCLACSISSVRCVVAESYPLCIVVPYFAFLVLAEACCAYFKRRIA
jgi:hypothetical protein